MQKESIEATIDDVLSRGVANLIDPQGVFKEKLLKKARGEYPQDIVIKFGVDPTRPDIHLGHAVVFRTLRKLQDLGCKLVFLIGDFTTQIGDPTGKSKTRPEIERAQVEKNLQTYLDQAGKIIRTDDAVFSWIRNSDWFNSVTDLDLPVDYKVGFHVSHEGVEIDTPVDANSIVGKAIVYENTRMQTKIKTDHIRKQISVITVASFLWTLRHITHAQLVKRDMFQDRITKNEDLYMHEMLYPVLQGIDSAIINMIYGSCDLEMGGTDQTFNMLMGRQIQEANKKILQTKGVSTDLQAVISMELLIGLDGKEKMSKSLGNYIAITDEPANMFGKVMSIPDSALVSFFKLCTYTPTANLKEIEKDLQDQKSNPRDIKMRLGREIVALYHGEDAATKAQESFIATFKKGTIPSDAPEVIVGAESKLVDVLISSSVIPSKSEFRRLLKEGALLNVDTDEKIMDPEYVITEPLNIRVGKRRFLKISL